MSVVTVIVVTVVIGIVLVHIKRAHSEVDFVHSRIDDRYYLVLNRHDKQRAADLLARLSRRLQRLIAVVRSRFPDDERGRFMERNFDPSSVSEGSQSDGYTSYSVSKGKKLVFCIRTDGVLEDINTIMYVAVHELAHLATTEYGHTPAFWDNFDWLLKEAVRIGLYRPVDYGERPQGYCGINIDSSILYPHPRRPHSRPDVAM